MSFLPKENAWRFFGFNSGVRSFPRGGLGDPSNLIRARNLFRQRETLGDPLNFIRMRGPFREKETFEDPSDLIKLLQSGVQEGPLDGGPPRLPLTCNKYSMCATLYTSDDDRRPAAVECDCDIARGIGGTRRAPTNTT